MKFPNKSSYLFSIFFISTLFFGGLFLVFPLQKTSGETDAISIRVIPNPNHYSPALWFERQGFAGPKQSLLVDGYEAIRSGPTVYVNVANVVDTTGNGNIDTLYTNIYMISSTEESTSDTQEIFSQILNNWKFNTNINPVGTCHKQIDKPCVYDSDCKADDYCTGDKARIIRDVKRLSDAVLIKEALEEYKQKNNHYPILAAGSYLPSVSLSVWPSWDQAFSKELGKAIPKDPLNILGDCPGYNEKTCWNEVSKFFVTDIYNGVLPDNSFVYSYVTNSKGTSYNFCFISDTSYISSTGTGCFSGGSGGGSGSPISIGGSAENTKPTISGVNLPNGYSGEKYSGFIEFFDYDKDVVSLSINTSPSTWSLWSSPVEIRNTPINNQKEIYADFAGAEGIYQFIITLNDGRGELNSVSSFSYNIRVINHPPVISASNVSYVASTTNPINHLITIVDALSNYPLIYSLSPPTFPTGISSTFSEISGVYNFNIFGPLSNTFSLPSTTDFNYTMTATDSFGAAASESFSIKIINNKPVVVTPLNCPYSTRVNNLYSCSLEYYDIDGHLVNFSIVSGTPGLLLNSFSGNFFGSLSSIGEHNITFRIADEYGASNQYNFPIKVNNYCGDGIFQSTNMEGVSEQCDDGNLVNDDACNDSCQWTVLGISSVDFSGGQAEAFVYDNNSDTNSTNNVPGGTYLKLSKSMPTPYIWVANSNIGQISKIRTFAGFKKNSDGYDLTVWENAGSLIGVYPVGDNPSRTAVNTENGDVWVANRDSANVTKLDINGNHLKTCLTGGGPRGLAIEENGDVWVANFSDANMVKISGDDFNCTILQTVNLGGAPYGLAIDSNNNVWVSGRSNNRVQRVNTSTFNITNYNTGLSPYGITVDLDDNVWVADTRTGVYKVIQSTGTVQHYSFAGLANANGRSRGVTIDSNGSIWISFDYSNQVVKIPDPNNPSVYGIFNVGGDHPIGIAGDSSGNVWAVNHNSNSVSVFSNIGTLLGNYSVNVSVAVPYTYSDMTGLNRGMLLRTGVWRKTHDSGHANQHWGSVSWQEAISPPTAKQSIEVYLRANDIDPEGSAWVDSVTWNSLSDISPSRMGRYLEIKIIFKSSVKGVTPVLWDLNIDGEIFL